MLHGVLLSAKKMGRGMKKLERRPRARNKSQQDLAMERSIRERRQNEK
jgi:hypothetical protein